MPTCVDISSFFLIFSTFPFFLRVAPFLISGGPKYTPHPSFHAHTADFSPSAHVCQNGLRVASVACQCGSQLQPGTVVANHFYQSLFSPCNLLTPCARPNTHLAPRFLFPCLTLQPWSPEPSIPPLGQPTDYVGVHRVRQLFEVNIKLSH